MQFELQVCRSEAMGGAGRVRTKAATGGARDTSLGQAVEAEGIVKADKLATERGT